jgi:hypothetical protein
MEDGRWQMACRSAPGNVGLETDRVGYRRGIYDCRLPIADWGRSDGFRAGAVLFANRQFASSLSPMSKNNNTSRAYPRGWDIRCPTSIFLKIL